MIIKPVTILVYYYIFKFYTWCNFLNIWASTIAVVPPVMLRPSEDIIQFDRGTLAQNSLSIDRYKIIDALYATIMHDKLQPCIRSDLQAQGFSASTVLMEDLLEILDQSYQHYDSCKSTVT